MTLQMDGNSIENDISLIHEISDRDGFPHYYIYQGFS